MRLEQGGFHGNINGFMHGTQAVCARAFTRKLVRAGGSLAYYRLRSRRIISFSGYLSLPFEISGTRAITERQTEPFGVLE